ncbi:MAG TPA: AI-2E family transporter [Oxalicibacterium sp.]|uniref:AI-2E family transporter n=1 Tax=Oxalicibacterium sp. TaxID=2766525 RepID=UPI002B5D0B2D|nr:AI-2E family transporter [Oxalicibacterium sp.]HWU97219.1 AI-2E family transporter [Oxalicibacterium sp.]
MTDITNEQKVAGTGVVRHGKMDTSKNGQDNPAVLLPIPVDARGIALLLIASIALVFALSVAHKFFIPLVFGIFIAYTLNPLVVWLERIHIPRLLGTSIIIAAILSSALLTVYNLRDEFNSILSDLPVATQKMSRTLKNLHRGQPSTIQQMQAAATEIEKATNQAAGVRAAPARKSADQSLFNLSDWLRAGSVGVMTFLSQVVMVIFLVFFFLLSGDMFKRKLVKISGRSLSTRKITVHILDAINTSIQHYMLMLLVTNALFGVLLWVALQWIGMANAGAWAIGAAFLHVIPYFGTVLIIAATSVSAFMQFEALGPVLAVSMATLVISTVVGTFVTTWMTGRIARMNAAAVFVSLLFWTWLWGAWGMLLGIPITVIVKVISEHVEGLHAVSELLGE